MVVLNLMENHAVNAGPTVAVASVLSWATVATTRSPLGFLK